MTVFLPVHPLASVCRSIGWIGDRSADFVAIHGSLLGLITVLKFELLTLSDCSHIVHVFTSVESSLADLELLLVSHAIISAVSHNT